MAKQKLSFFNKKVLKSSLAIISAYFTIATIVLTFLGDYIGKAKLWIFIGVVIISLLTYIIVYLIANHLSHIDLTINNSTVSIYFGDIFKETDNVIVPFNEYFDTTMDENVISPNTLHGKYLRTLNSTDTLDDEIEQSENLKDRIVNTNKKRIGLKQIRYRLGTILPRKKYFLLAFSKFDDENKAYLHQNEYVECLLEMWGQIDKIYNGNTVCIPLLGSGITRMKDNIGITDQELLEIMIWSFRISKIKFTYPSKVKIVLYKGKQDKINLYRLKGE
ncbi:MAG: DUF6430 domain-containing protein [Lachnospiraceae bacterium]|jgi:hypothetical protein|nr:DUF6430 domain-containing protein [Lachnospiraceae bacterium]